MDGIIRTSNKTAFLLVCHSEPFAALKGKLREESDSTGRMKTLRFAQGDIG